MFTIKICKYILIKIKNKILAIKTKKFQFLLQEYDDEYDHDEYNDEYDYEYDD